MCHVVVGRYRPDRTRTLHSVRSGAMASSSVRLQPPEPFNFKSPDEWPRWRRRFLQFRDASGLGDEGQQKQVSTLLYCMGESAEDVLTSMDISADDRKRFESVIAKFDSFFNRRWPQDGETAEEFITSLYQLVDSCDYGAMQDQMLRDRIVVGIRDQALSQRMQMDPELTLEKAKTLTRQKEAVREQQLMLENTTKTTTSVDQVQRSHQKGKRTQSHSFKPPPARPPSSKLCTKCGRVPIHATNAPPKTCSATNASTRDILPSSVALSQLLKLATSLCLSKSMMILPTSTLLARRMLTTGHVAFKSICEL